MGVAKGVDLAEDLAEHPGDQTVADGDEIGRGSDEVTAERTERKEHDRSTVK